MNEHKITPFAEVKQREDGSLVRIADCEPELDFDTWWEREGRMKLSLSTVAMRELCRTAWENGAFKAKAK